MRSRGPSKQHRDNESFNGGQLAARMRPYTLPRARVYVRVRSWSSSTSVKAEEIFQPRSCSRLPHKTVLLQRRYLQDLRPLFERKAKSTRSAHLEKIISLPLSCLHLPRLRMSTARAQRSCWRKTIIVSNVGGKQP